MERLAKRGIVISTLTRERQRDPDWSRKLYALDCAAPEGGYTSLRSSSSNPAMIALNEKLGFRCGLTIINLEKHL
jgi:hypothetical protein